MMAAMGATQGARPASLSIDPSQADAVSDAIARGFHDNEIWVWIQPHAARRHRLMVRNYKTLIRRVFLRRGCAWTTPGAAGAALWLPPGEPKRTRADGLAEIWSLVPWVGTGLGRGARADRLTAQHHPREPHWYLEVLAVRPERQRHGYGSALLAPGLERCDAERTPAYLETQREANVPYYRRFGFDVTGVIEDAEMPPLWKMWREPR